MGAARLPAGTSSDTQAVTKASGGSAQIFQIVDELYDANAEV